VNNDQHRTFIFVFTVLPLIGFIAGIFLLATGQVARSDWISFGAMYVVAGLGVSTGYHRLLAHRSFVTNRFLRYTFATFGAIAGQAPPIIWVAHHRRHHLCADQPGDPHSPYDFNDPTARLTLRGFWKAHLAWLFEKNLTSDLIRHCPDLVKDKGIRFISNHFISIAVAGIVFAGVIGWAVSGTAAGFLTGMLWGGLIRIFVGNHATYAINSVAHTMGRRRFSTPDQSRNVAWLAIPSFGEAWHNNHHAFPRSYTHGMEWYEIDLSAIVIRTLEKLGLAHDVVRINAAMRARVATRTAERAGERSAPRRLLRLWSI
jgi:stearoyl-CoA desaturase (Delta-9 desaturase)